MSIGNTIFLAGLFIAIACVAASAAAKRQGAAWNYYYFDGRAFVSGRPADSGPFVAVREQSLPVVLTQPATIEAVPLPAGKGAVVGICYIQSSGGKLGGSSAGYIPYPGLSLPVVSGAGTVTHVDTDQHGYFTAILDAGTYRIGNPPLSVEVTVEKGLTRLIPLRAGKRMVD